MSSTSITKQCCVVGGGPAGMMPGFLLARAGVGTRRVQSWRTRIRVNHAGDPPAGSAAAHSCPGYPASQKK